MLGLFWTILLAVAAAHSAVAAPSPAPMNLIVPSSDTQALTAPGVIDPRFSLFIFSQGANILDTDSGLLATLETLHRLGTYEFYGMMEPKVYVHPGYPAVSVSVQAKPGASHMLTRFAVWGIYGASQHVLQTQMVRNYVFVLRYDNTEVGFIEYRGTQAQLSAPGNNSISVQNHTQSSDTRTIARRKALYSPNSTNISNASLTDRHIAFGVWQDYGMDMTKWELFADIYVALLYIADFPTARRIPSPFTVRPAPSHQSLMSFDPQGSPSVAQYSDLASGLASMARYVVKHSVVHAVGFALWLDSPTGRRIGHGRIFKDPQRSDA